MKRSHTHIFGHMANCGCMCECMHELATVAAKKTVTFSLRFALSRRHRTITYYPFHMYMRTIGNNGCGLLKCKMESQLIRSPTRINSFILPLSFKSSGEVLYCCSSTLTEFCDWSSIGIEVSYRQSIDLALPIDSDRLQMWLLGQSDVSFGVLRLSKCLFRTSYDWSNRLYFRSPARHRPPPHPVSIFLCARNSRFASVWTGQNGNNIFLAATVAPEHY